MCVRVDGIRLRLMALSAFGLASGTTLDAPDVRAQGREVEIARMTSPEVAEAVRAGTTTIIIPTGGTEQNGRHMTLTKHNTIVAATARAIAETLGDALVAPVEPYVPEGDIAGRRGNMAFAGTVGVSPAVFEAVLSDVALSFKVHGFQTIVLLSDHGGSIEPQAAVAARLSRAWAMDGVRVIAAAEYYARNGGRDWLTSQGVSRAAFGGHADIEDTSALLALDPTAVHLDAVRPAGATGQGVDGATGDASGATAAFGRHLLALKVDAAVAEIRLKRSAPIVAPQPGLLARVYRLMFGASGPHTSVGVTP